jgi:ABC-type transporter Mla subunit MlaD
MEYNKWGQDASKSTDPKRPRFEPLHRGFVAEGLYTDPVRGPSHASARNVGPNNEPAKVYGFKSPKGNHWYIGEEENSEYIRIRTKGGTQILAHETLGMIYLNSKNGNSWVEISDEGVDVYSRYSISMRSQKDINIRADQDVNIEGGSSINLHTMHGPIRFNAEGGNIDGNTDRSFTMKAAQSGTMTMGTTMSMSSGSSTSINAGSSMDLTAGGVMSLKGALILQNSGGIGGMMSLGGLAGGLGGLTGGLSSFTSSLGSMANSVMSQVSNLGNFVGDIANNVGNFVGDMANGISESLSNTFSSITDNLQSVVSDITSVDLGSIAENITTQVGDLGNITENLTSYTTEISGLSDHIPGLESITENLGNISETFDLQSVDLNNIAESVSGITGESGLGSIQNNLQSQFGSISTATTLMQGNVGSLNGIGGNLSSVQNMIQTQIPSLDSASGLFNNVNMSLGDNIPNVTDFTSKLQNIPSLDISNINSITDTIPTATSQIGNVGDIGNIGNINLNTITDTMTTATSQVGNVGDTLTGASLDFTKNNSSLLNIGNKISNNIGVFNASSLGLSAETLNLENISNNIIGNGGIKDTLVNKTNDILDNKVSLDGAKNQLNGTIGNLTQLNETAQHAGLASEIDKLVTLTTNVGDISNTVDESVNKLQSSTEKLTATTDKINALKNDVNTTNNNLNAKVENISNVKEQITNTGSLLNNASRQLDVAKENVNTLHGEAEKYTTAAKDHQNSVPSVSGTPDTILNPPSYPQTSAKTILSRMPAHEPWPLHNKRTNGGLQSNRTNKNLGEGRSDSIRGQGNGGTGGDPKTNKGDPKSAVGNASPFKGDPNALGSLSSRYESNGKPGAIGHDSTGGWSYGSYQIAANTGTMDNYMNYLKNNNPDQYEKLQAAGGAAAAKRGDPAFKDAWKELSSSDPAFGQSQHDFIKATHYDKAADRLDGLGLDVNNRSKALQDVVWSTSVQHGAGGSQSMFNKALAGRDPNSMSDEEIINALYDERSKTNIYFKSSTPAVQSSVGQRFNRERQDALSMLRNDTQYAAKQSGTSNV